MAPAAISLPYEEGKSGEYCSRAKALDQEWAQTMDIKKIMGLREITSHDADGLKHFWEKKIEKQTIAYQIEDARRGKSALSKLREEWKQRLESRISMLQSLQEEQKRQLYAKQPEPKANTAA